MKPRRPDGQPWEISLCIAVDPGQRKADVVAWYESDHIHVCGLDGHVNHLTVDDLRPNQRVLVAIEKPAGNWSRFRPAQIAANRVADQVRRLWPRKALIVFVDPRRWQGELGIDTCAGEQFTIKDYSRAYCKAHLDYNPPDDDHADARCLLEYLLRHLKAYRRGNRNNCIDEAGG